VAWRGPKRGPNGAGREPRGAQGDIWKIEKKKKKENIKIKRSKEYNKKHQWSSVQFHAN